MKGIGGILSGIWALRPDLNLSRRYMENYGEVEGAQRLELIGWSSSAGAHRLELIRGGVKALRHWILP